MESFRRVRRRSGTSQAGCAAIVCGVLLALFLNPAAHPQTEKSGRKLLTQVSPIYPQELKRAFIGGQVHLKIVVSPSGNVDQISVAGGNAALVESAVKAVKQWKYAPAVSSSSIHVNLNFDPYH